MESKTVLCFFVLLVCSFKSGSSSVIPHLTVNFEQNLNDAMEREYHAIGLLRDGFKDVDFITEMKEPYRSITTDTYTEFVNELQQHYDELKQESSNTETVPNMEHNLIEAKMAEMAPKYIDKYSKRILAEINAEPTIPTKSKIVINRETNLIVKKINELFIPSLLNEIKNNPKDWIGANPIDAVFLHKRSKLPEGRELYFEKIGERMKPIAATFEMSLDSHMRTLTSELFDYIEVFYKIPTRHNSEETISSEEENEME